MWDVLTYDYNKGVSRKNCLKESIKATRPGSIVVFHDSLKAEKNMKYALPQFIEHFSKMGYSFESITLIV
jgi:peptidoglycan-N-acetylglucosamine deacetylase